MKKFSVIAAVSKGWAMGHQGALPWPHLLDDMIHFRSHTLNRSVIMGRRTYESMGGPLPQRETIVISKTKVCAKNVHTVPTLHSALELASRTPYVIGGATVYEEALPYASDIYLTVINGEYKGDTFFPHAFLSHFECVDIKGSKNKDLCFLHFVKKSS